MFTITSIKILPECKYRKNLRAGMYEFGQGMLGFFGSNISLHAIVGKNGSGKSSLMELMFRMINNFGAVICKDADRNAAENIAYVKGVYADLAFVKSYDEENLENGGVPIVHHGVLSIRDTNMWLWYDGELFFLCDCGFIVGEEDEPYHEEIEHVKLVGRDLSAAVDDFSMQDLADCFFYTIATNYSLQGFLAPDFDDEESMEYGPVNVNVDIDGLDDDDSRPLKMWYDTTNWIDRLFHKNDGYLCPIVLNPYRNGGNMDVYNEMELTMSRLSALLVMGDDIRLMENYSLDELRYQYNSSFYKKFTPIYVQGEDGLKRNELADGGDIRMFKKMMVRDGSFASVVLDVLDIEGDENLADVEVAARMYVVYKILSIAKKYPQYAEFRELGNVDNTFRICNGMQDVKLKQLVEYVKVHHSHIEMKTHQTICFIRSVVEAKSNGRLDDMKWMMKEFSLVKYVGEIGIELDRHDLERCMMQMPPSLFKQDILLKRSYTSGMKRKVARKIPFGRLSTGEKQFLCQMSTLVYHLMNLSSVSNDAVRYKDVNIVLDEIEVCFHPEYQRMFVSRLLQLLDRQLGFNSLFNIHIWITTHSPFILSDIPQCFVTYMDEGRWIKPAEVKRRGILNPFAANVNDILHQSFFLEKGFIGEFARNKIMYLVDSLKNENNLHEWSQEDVRSFIEGLDEKLIRKLLMEMYRQRYEENFDRR